MTRIMDKELTTFIKAYAEHTVYPETITGDGYHDAAQYAAVVRSEMDGRVVAEVGRQAVRHIANKAQMSEHELLDFIRFLREDPELRDRFTAYKTAKRLRGE